jgi:hypothetical protein
MTNLFIVSDKISLFLLCNSELTCSSILFKTVLDEVPLARFSVERRACMSFMSSMILLPFLISTLLVNSVSVLAPL